LKEQKKKKLIASLLLVSCFISGYILFANSDEESKRLRDFAKVDSLIQKKLTDFNIDDQQVRITTTRIDSNFSRKTYHIALPYRFSKTQFHAELNRTFHDLAIETPAKVTFPEQNTDIHFLHRGTVIRTLSLQTDPELVMNRSTISILITFEQLPDEELITDLASLGEPIPIVIKVENPIQANNLKKQINSHYNRIIFWLQNKDGESLITANPNAAVLQLKQLENVLPEARILQFQQNDQTQQQLMTNTNLTFVSATNALLLNEELDKASFFEKLNKLYAKSGHSIAVITGSKTTLSWLQEKLPELKKAGIDLVPPPQINF
jgi:hypothetical protein